MLDDDHDGWPDLLVANDTQPNKLYRNQRNGTFKDIAVEAGLAFSSEGKARAGMGVDAADFKNSGAAGVAITNFDNEMIGLYQASGKGFEDIAAQTGVGLASKNSLGFGCVFLDADLDGWLDLAVANGHIDETVRNIQGNVGYAQPPQLFLNRNGVFRDVAAEIGGGFDQPKVGRGLACADFDRDGDLDLLLTPTMVRPASTERTACRERHHTFPSGRYQVKPRCHRSKPAHLSWWGKPVSYGESRLQLFVAVRTPGDIRAGKARSD